MATTPAAKKTAAKSAPLKASAEASTSVAVKKPTGGAIVSIQEALKAQAASMGERTQPAGGNKIRLSKGKFTLPDGTETAGPLELVVVDFIAVNKFYEGVYNAKEVTPPACFAISTNPKQMTPSANSPMAQSESCQGCPMNEFGSGGNGKACKNGRSLAVLPPDADSKTDMWILDVSPTGLKNFDGFVGSTVRLFQMPPVGVVVTVSLDPSVDYPRLVFSDPQPNANLEVCYARQGEARGLLEVEPDVSGYKEPAKAPARKGVAARR